MSAIADAEDIGVKRIYIAGAMSGIEKWNFPAFQRAALFLRALGHIAVVPSEIDRALYGFDGEPELPAIMTRKQVLAVDLGVVLPTCDVIYMLKGWHLSSGAVAEKTTAETYDLDYWYEAGAVKIDVVAAIARLGKSLEVSNG